MSETLKNILDEVSLESGMDTEAEYATSDIDAVKRLVSFANAGIRGLMTHTWQSLLKTYEFTLTAEDTTYALPSDYKKMIPDTMYSDSHLWPVQFPTDAKTWGYLQASGGGTGTQDKIRLMGNLLQVYEPEAGKVIRVEYMGQHPIVDADGSVKKRFTADTDTVTLDYDLVLMETMWRYQRLLGLDTWQGIALESKNMVNVELGNDAGARTIQMDWERGGHPYYDLWRPVPNVTS